MIQHGTQLKYRTKGNARIIVVEFWQHDHADVAQATVDAIREKRIPAPNPNMADKAGLDWVKIQEASVDFFRCKPIARDENGNPVKIK